MSPDVISQPYEEEQQSSDPEEKTLIQLKILSQEYKRITQQIVNINHQRQNLSSKSDSNQDPANFINDSASDKEYSISKKLSELYLQHEMISLKIEKISLNQELKQLRLIEANCSQAIENEHSSIRSKIQGQQFMLFQVQQRLKFLRQNFELSFKFSIHQKSCSKTGSIKKTQTSQISKLTKINQQVSSNINARNAKNSNSFNLINFEPLSQISQTKNYKQLVMMNQISQSYNVSQLDNANEKNVSQQQPKNQGEKKEERKDISRDLESSSFFGYQTKINYLFDKLEREMHNRKLIEDEIQYVRQIFQQHFYDLQAFYLNQMYGARNQTQNDLKQAISYLYAKAKDYNTKDYIYKGVKCLEKCEQLLLYIKKKDINFERQIIFLLGYSLLLQGHYFKARERIQKALYFYQNEYLKKIQCSLFLGKCEAQLYNNQKAISLLEQARKNIDKEYHFDDQVAQKVKIIVLSVSIFKQFNNQFSMNQQMLKQHLKSSVSSIENQAKQIYIQILESLFLIYAYRWKKIQACQYFIKFILLLPSQSYFFSRISLTQLLVDWEIIQKKSDFRTILHFLEKYPPYLQKFCRGITAEFLIIQKNIGTLYIELGYFQKSYEILKKAQQMIKQNKLRDITTQCIILQCLGELQFSYFFDCTKALDTFLQILVLIGNSEGRFTLKWTQILNRIGVVFLAMNQRQKALISFQKCLSCISQLQYLQHNTSLVTIKVYILINLIETQIRYCESKKSDTFFGQIMKIIDQAQQQQQITDRLNKQAHQFHRLSGEFYTSISIAYQKRGDTQKSLHYATKALENYQQSKQDFNFIYLISIRLRISYLLQLNKRFEEALKMYHETLNDIITWKGQRTLIQAEIQNQIGSIYIQMGQYLKGIPYLKRQMEIRNYYSTKQRIEIAPFIYPTKFLSDNRNFYTHLYHCFKSSQEVLENLNEKCPQIYKEHIDFILERKEYVRTIKKSKVFKSFKLKI